MAPSFRYDKIRGQKLIFFQWHEKVLKRQKTIERLLVFFKSDIRIITRLQNRVVGLTPFTKYFAHFVSRWRLRWTKVHPRNDNHKMCLKKTAFIGGEFLRKYKWLKVETIFINGRSRKKVSLVLCLCGPSNS